MKAAIEVELDDTASLEQISEMIVDVRNELLSIKRLGEQPGWELFKHFVLLNASNLRNASGSGLIESLDGALHENGNRGIAIGLERVVNLLSEIEGAYLITLRQLEAFAKEKEDARNSTDASDGDTEPEQPELYSEPLGLGQRPADQFAP